jgi:hypothetical protein
MGAASQEQGCVGVPEIMPPYRWQPRLLKQGFEVAVYDVLGVEGGALVRSENESLILPF